MGTLENRTAGNTPLGGRSSRWNRFLPIVLAEAYLSFTVIVFAFGPWPWPVQNSTTLYCYLFLVQLALLIGYLSTKSDSPAIYTGNISRSSLLNISVILNLVWAVPYFYLHVGPEGLSLRGILAMIAAGLSDPSQAYLDKLNQATGGSNYLLYAYMLCSPVLWVAVPLGISAWGSLSMKMRAAIVFITIANSATWIASGTTKGIADNVAMVAVSILATRKWPSAHHKLFASLNSLSRAVVVAVAIFILVYYFSYSQSSRSSGRISLIDYDAGIMLDTNNIFVVGLPPVLQAAVGKGTSYLGQGYYGLSLALQEPFEWSYGVGHSMSLTGVVKKLTGVDAAEKTYMAREQHAGWDMLRRWDSVYPWFASDVTFPGTLLVVFLIGRLLASLWADVQEEKNPYAVPLFVMVMIMIFYFPANDQILEFYETVFAFWGLLFLWLSTRGAVLGDRKRVWN